jgi:uncharacterized membrane protein YcaP (DUF421 family)
MTLGHIIVRALVAYLYLLFVTRVSGKRVVSQATPFDFIVALILGDLIDDAVWAEVSVAKFAGAVGSILLCDALTKLGAFHSLRFFHVVNGWSHALLRDGHEDGDELRRQQLNEGDLAHLLRMKGIDDWSQVHLALIERGHELSVIRCPENEPATKADAERVKELTR